MFILFWLSEALFCKGYNKMSIARLFDGEYTSIKYLSICIDREYVYIGLVWRRVYIYIVPYETSWNVSLQKECRACLPYSTAPTIILLLLLQVRKSTTDDSLCWVKLKFQAYFRKTISKIISCFPVKARASQGLFSQGGLKIWTDVAQVK